MELRLAPRFQRLLEALLPQVTSDELRVIPEFRRAGIGRPDLALVRTGNPPRAFIELKQPNLDLIPSRFTGHNADQFSRFCELPLWSLSNFWQVQLYRRSELIGQAEVVPLISIDPTTPKTIADRLIREHNFAGFIQILRGLANASPPAANNAQDLAKNLAYAARLVRSVVISQCEAGLNEVAESVRSDFNEVLFARAEAGGYDPSDMNALFADAFAQTLVFGLLLAREAGDRVVDQHAYELLDNASYPLLRGTLRALTLEEVRNMLGVAFDVAFDAVNAVDPQLLAPRNGDDPVLYLYEDFLRVFDPKAVEKYGVYYTPPEIVRLIVSETDNALRRGLAEDGLLCSDVQLLDPACGTGTFLIAAAAEVAALASTKYGSGAVPAEIAAFGQRMYGFELLVGPYTVSHYRMMRAIAAYGGGTDRLPIYLADTLAAPASGAIMPNLDFLSAPMVAEREAADQVKSNVPILVVMGNPPYKRLKQGEVQRLVGKDMMVRWEDLKRPVRDAGFGRSLNAFPDLYIAFWRWAIWRIFEAEGATGRGIVAYITNRSYLTGSGFGGLRLMLRKRFDHIRIIDFRGDRRGARPATVEKDENVFNIETGVCILIGVANGKASGNEATIEYADVWRAGATTRKQKLALANRVARDPQCIEYRNVPTVGMDILTPPGFDDTDWPAVDELFNFRANGLVTYRDSFVYATDRHILENRIQKWLKKPLSKAEELFKNSAANFAGNAQNVRFDANNICEVGYRPLDTRYLYAHPKYVDRLRPDLRDAWRNQNEALIARSDGTGRGPAVWCHGRIPDQHSFMGSGGGWIFPYRDHSAANNGHRLKSQLVAGLSEAYGREIAAQAVFDTIIALLSASSYTTRFASDLENSFPHVPFPADPEVFSEAAMLGARIRKLQTFSVVPNKKFRKARIEGKAVERILDVPTPSRAILSDIKDLKSIALRSDKSCFVANVSAAAWELSISSNRLVLYSWLKARNGRELTAVLQRELLDIIARIEELLNLFDLSDVILQNALRATLTRNQIGLPIVAKSNQYEGSHTHGAT